MPYTLTDTQILGDQLQYSKVEENEYENFERECSGNFTNDNIQTAYVDHKSGFVESNDTEIKPTENSIEIDSKLQD